ncbi:MAG TPA: HisA/HisF-related TIM barrel protein [Dictyoglomaceae bacterium]|nr:HisA/HisF-related TIM barrel protein [Dictyoglomaceae bacterium]HOL38694.1 HisA/HisF-related TIM barrel protein [Dictyoglomaceae bacterium]HOP94602.1 HisA/HisF-related TIM barrel protein [Dictyoglomaceae bacterium]HPP15557.1 HisA/HisF-related TIM barrel protein [Dictyoglomaceae bacterium]HPU42872.1 HisA/HisF-related TIM barrel protein [Dictyoglomaceae bacterium]
MLIIPAIDLYRNKVVRMEMGDEEKIVLEFENPLELAKYWWKKGAKALHLIDLQNAIDEQDENKEIIRKIIGEISLPIEVGGGFRTLEKIHEVISWGAWRVIVSSILKEDMRFLEMIFEKYPDKVIPSLDWRDRKIAIKGWKEFIPWDEVKEKLEKLGIKEVIFTDTSRDGTLKGIDKENIEKFLEDSSFDIWIAGGISTLEDITKIKEISEKLGRVKGIIIGRALLQGKLNWEEVNRILNAC